MGRALSPPWTFCAGAQRPGELQRVSLEQSPWKGSVASSGKAGAGSKDSHPAAEWAEGKPLFEKKAKVDLVHQCWFSLFNQPTKPSFQLMRFHQEPAWFPRLIPPLHSHKHCAEEKKGVTKNPTNGRVGQFALQSHHNFSLALPSKPNMFKAKYATAKLGINHFREHSVFVGTRRLAEH